MKLFRFFQRNPKRLPLVQNMITEAIRAKAAAPAEGQFLRAIAKLRDQR